MFISEYARALLNAGKIDELKALSYRQLLPTEVRQEILALFLRPETSLLESTGPALCDPLSLSMFSDSCVVSSGHIYSKAMAEELFSSADDRDVICPMSREILIKDINGPRKSYLLLPKIDDLIQNFRSLRSSTTLLHTLPVMSEIYQSAQQSEDFSARHSIGTVQLQVSKGRVKLFFNMDRRSSVCYDVLCDYFNFVLPQGEINPRWKSYFMDAKQFGRCWSARGEHSLQLNLWFPSADFLPKDKRTFSDYHLTQILSSMLRVLEVPLAAEDGAPLETYSVADLEKKVYVIALNDTAATFAQMFKCAQIFLDYTKRFSNQLGFDVIDIANAGRAPALPSRVSGEGFFGSAHNVLTTSLISSSLRK